MEIRRKVFSAIEDEDGEVRLYSTVDVDSYNYNDDYDYVESLYSDAYADGYEYAQREFAEEEDKKKGLTPGQAADIAGGVGLAGGALLHKDTIKNGIKSVKLSKKLKQIEVDALHDMRKANTDSVKALADQNRYVHKLAGIHEDMAKKYGMNHNKTRNVLDNLHRAVETRDGYKRDIDDSIKYAKKHIKNIRMNNQAIKYHTGGLVRTAGKIAGGAALAGGLAAAGTAAYNHFKNKDNK